MHCAWRITTNIQLSAWGNYLGDVPLAVAVLDRLAMHAVHIDIDGPSYRQHVAKERANKQRRTLQRPQSASHLPESRAPTTHPDPAARRTTEA